MKKCIVIGIGILIFLIGNKSNAAELNCAKKVNGVSECEAMGYTRISRFNPLKDNDNLCGTGTIAFCPAYKGRMFCIPRMPVPILFGDGTTGYELVKDKTPIGIVFDKDHRLAISFISAGYVQWSTEQKQVWSDCDDWSRCHTDGKENTNYLLKKGADLYPAAKAANEYEPEGCVKDFCRKGKWWLPSNRELQLYNAYHLFVNEYGMILNNGRSIGDIGGWSSNEYSDRSAYDLYAAKHTFLTYSKTDKGSVYPVVKY